MKNDDYSKGCGVVLDECGQALAAINSDQVQKYMDCVLHAEKIFFVGVGRVLLSLEAIAKRYAHLGIRAVIVGEITEPAIGDRDVLIVGSGSGETMFPVGIAKKAKAAGAKIVHIGSNPDSELTEITDVFVRIPVASKKKLSDEIKSQQPMTSLFEQSLLLFGDVTAKLIIDSRNIDLDSLWQYHANLE